jgi:ribonuclease-3
MEALIGAIYLDSGFASAKEHIFRFILSDIEHKKLFFDSKTILQEMVQGKEEAALSYRLIKEEGPDHNKKFTAAVYLGSKELARGVGKTKKASEQAAAYEAVMQLRQK